MVTGETLEHALLQSMAEMHTRKPLYQEVERLKTRMRTELLDIPDAAEKLKLYEIVRTELENQKGEYRQVGAHNGYDVYARPRSMKKDGNLLIYADFSTVKTQPNSFSDISHFAYLTDRNSSFEISLGAGFHPEHPRVIEGITALLKDDKGRSPVRDYIGVASAIVINGLAWYTHDPSVQEMSNHHSISHWFLWSLITAMTVLGGALLASGVSKQLERKRVQETQQSFHHTTGWEAIQIIAQEIEQVDRK